VSSVIHTEILEILLTAHNPITLKLYLLLQVAGKEGWYGTAADLAKLLGYQAGTRRIRPGVLQRRRVYKVLSGYKLIKVKTLHQSVQFEIAA